MSEPPPAPGDIPASKPDDAPKLQQAKIPLWLTLLASIWILLLYVTSQGALMVGYAWTIQTDAPRLAFNDALSSATASGSAWATAALGSALLGTVLIFALLSLRRDFAWLLQRLALRAAPLGAYLVWTPSFLVLVFLLNALLKSVGHQAISDTMAQGYAVAAHPWLFWIAFVVAAPIFEELFFRGFLYAGLEESRLGTVGAIAVTSLLWGRLHMMHDATGMIVIMTLGVALGAARAQTRSVFPPLALHMLNNLIAMYQTAARAQNL